MRRGVAILITFFFVALQTSFPQNLSEKVLPNPLQIAQRHIRDFSLPIAKKAERNFFLQDYENIRVFDTLTIMSTFYDTTHEVYTYDSLGRKNTFTIFDNSFSPIERSEYSYYPDNKLEYVANYWMDLSGNWQPISREYFTYDDSSITYMGQHPDSSIGWVTDFTERQVYDPFGNLQKIETTSCFGSICEQYLVIYQYVGDLLSQYVSYEMDDSANVYVPQAQGIFFYDSLNRVTQLYEEVNTDTGFVPQYRSWWQYSDSLSGACVSWWSENYDELTGNWVPTMREDYSYDVWGHRSERINLYWQDSLWMPSAREVMTYLDSSALLHRLTQEWDSNGWEDRTQSFYNYDTLDYITYVHSEEKVNGIWQSGDESVYVFDDSDTLYYYASDVFVEYRFLRVLDVKDKAHNPEAFALYQNYPNPFNPVTTIKFSIPKESEVTLNVYDVLGRRVQTLVNKKLSAGLHKVTFNGENLSSGVYFYRLKFGNKILLKKMVLLK